jgi:hypothetical protein
LQKPIHVSPDEEYIHMAFHQPWSFQILIVWEILTNPSSVHLQRSRRRAILDEGNFRDLGLGPSSGWSVVTMKVIYKTHIHSIPCVIFFHLRVLLVRCSRSSWASNRRTRSSNPGVPPLASHMAYRRSGQRLANCSRHRWTFNSSRTASIWSSVSSYAITTAHLIGIFLSARSRNRVNTV